jgi:hypothetical protein
MAHEDLMLYLEESPKAIAKIFETTGLEISSMELQLALADVFGLTDRESVKILGYELKADEMVERLRGYSFYRPDIVEKVTLDHSILPDDVPDILNEEEVKFKGQIWEIHKYDKDPFPSNPHAHLQGLGYKLHLGTGEIFKKRKSIGKLAKKDLKEIRSLITKVTLPELLV